MSQVKLRLSVKGFVSGNIRSTYYHGMNKDPYKERQEQDDQNNLLNELEKEENLDNLEDEDQNEELFDPYEELEMEEPVIDPTAPMEQKTIKVIDENDRHRPDPSVAQPISQMFRPHNKAQENLN